MQSVHIVLTALEPIVLQKVQHQLRSVHLATFVCPCNAQSLSSVPRAANQSVHLVKHVLMQKADKESTDKALQQGLARRVTRKFHVQHCANVATHRKVASMVIYIPLACLW